MRRSAILLLLLCLASRLDATVLVPIDFSDLVSSAPVIVRGDIVDVRSDWVDGRRAVETFVTMAAREYLKGNLGARVTFRVPGGEIGRYRTIFVGAPLFQPGQDVLLFLQTDGAAYPHVVGLNQGVVRVAIDGSGRRFAVVPPSVTKIDRLMPFDAFEDTLRQVVRDGARDRR
jgi:hypothetical protein